MSEFDPVSYIMGAKSAGGGGGGGGGGALIVHESYDEQNGAYVLDKTWQEIADASLAGIVALIMAKFEGTGIDRTEIRYLSYTEEVGGEYTVYFENHNFYTTDSPDKYPTFITD